MLSGFMIANMLVISALGGVSATVSLNPKATYLHVSNDAALATAPVNLAALGYQPGDQVKITRLGEFDFGPGGKIPGNLLGVFSSTNVLLADTNLNRVPGAIEAGTDFVTSCTFFNCQATDIPEDFLIAASDGLSASLCITIPAGAAFLFVCPHDSWYQDNSDPNGNFGVQLSPLECVADIAPAGGNGSVNIDDLLAVINNWGALGGVADVSPLCGNGIVNIDDLLAVINAWGPCP